MTHNQNGPIILRTTHMPERSPKPKTGQVAAASGQPTEAGCGATVWDVGGALTLERLEVPKLWVLGIQL